MDNTENIISFCTGYGGIELGLHRVIENLRTLVYVEIETFAIANLVAKIEQGKMDTAPIWSDIKTFPAEIFRDKVHGIIGGYPCQPFSHAGQRKGTADPRHLWPYILGHIRTIRPVWCFFENVAGHLTLGFKEVQQSLRDIGYKVEPGKFTAAEVGFPHKRQRLFFLAYDNNRTSNSAIIKKSIRQAQPESCDDSGKRGLADSAIDGPLREPGSIQQEDGRQGGTLLRQPVKPSIELANTEKQGLERGTRNRRKTADTRLRQDCWLARPGQPQYEWEEPRTVKPSMGRTVDGFKSRVDELRLLGNGVVPATAELAFRTLMGLFK